jgi:hypothetical protein
MPLRPLAQRSFHRRVLTRHGVHWCLEGDERTSGGPWPVVAIASRTPSLVRQ